MAESKDVKRDEETGRRLSPDEVRAQDLAQGKPEDGSIVLTNDSGEIKHVTQEEWDNEAYQAQLLQKGWKVLGGGEEKK